MNTAIYEEAKRLNDQGRALCGQTGVLQLSAWTALDLGASYEEWAEAVAAVRPMNPVTFRKQFRLVENDRNACLVDDGQADAQTTYGKKA